MANIAQVETVALLREGIAAARSGDKAKTQKLLRQVTELEPHNELAWLWLSNTAEDPREALACLRQVLMVNPKNEYAATSMADSLCRAGVAAAKTNDRVQAKAWFAEATDLAPRNETAWLWRAGMADTPEEGIELLQFVLAINPNNDRAKQGIAHYRTQLTPKWRCPLCEAIGIHDESLAVCPSCRAVIKLTDPKAFDQPIAVDRGKLEPVAHRLYADLMANPTSDVAFRLGLTYLNLGYADEGTKALQSAVRVRPTDPAWRGQVSAFMKHQQIRAANLAAEAERKRTAPKVRPTIMIVDDSPTIRKLVSVTLNTSGYQVFEAEDGYQVADRVRQHGLPKLFLLDVNMPGLDGFQLCKMLRQNLETAKVPVMFLTGKDGFINKMRGQWAGASDYLTKPFDPKRLLEAVSKVVPIPSSGS